MINFVTVLLLTSICVGGVVTLLPTYNRCADLEKQVAELEDIISTKRREIAQYELYQQRFENDVDFLEDIARQNHWVYPHELVFIFEK